MAMTDRRPLGHSGLQVSPLCLGTNVFGWTADERAAFAVLDAYAEAGGNFIDTANSYATWGPGNVGGESETIIGRWMRSRGTRDAMVVATKVGSQMPGLGQAFGLTRPLIRAGAEASLARLGVDRIDLFYAHWPDPDTDLTETLGAFDELVRAGMVHAPAASNFGAGLLRRALEISRDEGLARMEALQPPYSLMRRSPYEGELEDLCLAEEIGVAPYYSLARGFLTGKYRPGRPLPASARASGVAADHMNEFGFAVLEALDRVAADHGATTAQVALAWLMARPSITAPIASATTAEQARELCGAADLELSEEQIRLVDEASRPVAV